MSVKVQAIRSVCPLRAPTARGVAIGAAVCPGRGAGTDGSLSDHHDQQPSDTEEEHGEALARVVDEGRTRLSRSWPSLAATGVVGGFDVGMGVLAALVVHHATGNELLSALAFGIGFVLLVLAGSELFTENFFVPVVTVVASKDFGPMSVLRLWVGTLVFNVIAGFVFMALVVTAVPKLDSTVIELGRHWPDVGIGTEAFASAVLAGMVMTLLTWLEHRSADTFAKITLAVAMGFVLTATPLNHAIVRTIEMSGALLIGAPFGYLDAAQVLGWASLGNMAGGLGLVTVVRLVQIGAEKIREEQAHQDGAPRSGETANR